MKETLVYLWCGRKLLFAEAFCLGKLAFSVDSGQFDGNDTTNDAEDIDDELYKETEHYWKSGWLGMSYQNFKDATKIIDESDLSEEEKQNERDALVGARKDAFGDGSVHFPPLASALTILSNCIFISISESLGSNKEH